MKRILSVILAVAMVLSMSLTAGALTLAHPFADSWGHWANQSITWAFHEGLISGTSVDTFSPNMNLTRGMFVTMLYRMAGEPEVELQTTPYSDVSAKDYYYKAALWANESMNYGNYNFKPNEAITRLEAAELLHRYMFYDYRVKNPDAPNISLAYKDYPEHYTDTEDILDSQGMKWAVQTGIIMGRTPTTLDPHGNLTRAEATEILYRFAK